MIVHRLPPAPKALVFDIDNTLYSDPRYGEAQTRLQVERLAAERGEAVAETEAALDRVRAEYAEGNGGRRTSLANAFALLGISIETSVRWRIELLKPEDYLKKDPALIRALKELSRGYRLAALTNNPAEIGKRTLECLGVAHFFQEIVGLDCTGRSKPSPEPFAEILKRLGLEAADCISVGDRFDVDLKPPLDMGMGAIEVGGVEDVYALPEALAGKNAPQPGLQRWLRSLPFAFLVLAAASFALKTGIDSYSIPLIDEARDRLDARLVASCYARAYPDLIGEPRRDEASGEWILTVRGEAYAYANGRWTPPKLAKDWKNFRPYVDAVYPWELIEPALLPAPVLRHLRELPMTQEDAPPTEGGFAFSLYGGNDKASVYARQTRMDFLGRRVTVHELCAPALARADARISAAARGSAEVRAFLDTIDSVGAFNWREIRGQRELSRHSFGIAVDVLPKGWERKSVYWQWDASKGLDWAVLPLAKRWAPPEQVVDIMESEGFVWGGKWLVYDTMHFEYRPEMLLLRERVLPRFLSVLK